MPAYRVELAPGAERQFRKLERQVQIRVGLKFDALEKNPRPPGSEKLAGGEDLFRVRVGDYRVVYQIFDKRLSREVSIFQNGKVERLNRRGW